MSIVTPTQPVAELQPLAHHSRRVRAGTAPSPARSRAAPVSNDERADLLDDDALLRAARHRAELKLERSRGQQEGYTKAQRSLSAWHFWSGAAFGFLVGCALLYSSLKLGVAP